MMDDSTVVRRRSNEPDRAGYISIEDENLPPSGVRGRRSYCLVAVVVILLLLAITNALITAGLFYLLSITHEGMASVEFLSDTGYLRVIDDLHLEELQVDDAIVGSIRTHLGLSGKMVVVGVKNGSEVKLDYNNTVITSEDFELNTHDGKPLFSTKMPLNLELYQVKNLQASGIGVNTVSSQAMFPDLLIESFHEADVFGMEGVHVETDGSIEINAEKNDIILQSFDGSLSFDQEEGIMMSQNLPVDGKDVPDSKKTNEYKVCVCGSNGHVFVVQDEGTDTECHVANDSDNLCE